MYFENEKSTKVALMEKKRKTLPNQKAKENEKSWKNLDRVGQTVEEEENIEKKDCKIDKRGDQVPLCHSFGKPFHEKN